MKHLKLLFLILAILSSCSPTTNDNELERNDNTNNISHLIGIDRLSESLTPNDAKTVATIFAEKKGVTRSSNSISDVMELKDSLTQKPLVYIVNWGQNNGFAIISANKKTAPIFAFSDTGFFDLSEKSPAMEYLNKYKQSVKTAQEDNTDTLRTKYALQWADFEKCNTDNIAATRGLNADMQKKLENERKYRESLGYKYIGTLSSAQYYLPQETYQLLLKEMKECTDPQYDYMETTQLFIKSYDYEIIDKLLSTEWHQYEPFNVDATNKLAGCVPIAVAQIVYYYKYPNKYNWNNIYINPVLNDDFKYFIKDIRNLCDVDYKAGGTSSNIDKAKSAFQKLGYTVVKTDYDVTSTLRSQIQMKRPVYMRGESSDGSGHAWICDGYQNIKYDAITTFMPNKSDPKFKFEPTSKYGFATYELSVYPPSSLNMNQFGEYFHMNFGWYNGLHNGWYRENSYIPSAEKSYQFEHKILTIKK